MKEIRLKMELVASGDYLAEGTLIESWPEHIDFKSMMVAIYIACRENLID